MGRAPRFSRARESFAPKQSLCPVSTTGRDYVGLYRLIRVILAGRTCVVWEAMHDDTKERVAIKMLSGEHRKDREQISMLRHEHTVGSPLDHPCVLHIREFAIDRGTPYLAMDFFDGRNLKQEIRNVGAEALAWRAERMIEQLAEGLEYFHQQNWVHRDLKPDNILVNDEELKLIDFAIAQRPKTGLAKLFSLKGKVQGTRSYMSPEQIRAEPIDCRADIYSFGCTVFELISGKPPYTASDSNDLLNKHLRAPVPSLTSAAGNVTRDFSRLIGETLAKKRDGRPPSMSDFLERYRGMRVFRTRPRRPEATEKAQDSS